MAQMEAWISMSAQLAVIFSHGILGFQQRTGSGWGAVEGFGRTILLFFSSLSLPLLSQLILSKQAQTPTQASTHSISRT